MKIQPYKRVLTIAGSDSGGGAGIQGDLKAISALGCHGTTVITALTAQNTVGVSAIKVIPTSFIREQFVAIQSDIGFDAIKIGMLANQQVMETINDLLTTVSTAVPIVVDPVMVATSGDQLLELSAVEYLKHNLLPRASVVTPNRCEAEILLDCSIKDKTHMQQGARKLANQFKTNVLLKGGHLPGQHCSDYLFDYHKQSDACYVHQRVDTNNSHGTGCALASALAACLAHGKTLSDATQQAIGYVNHCLITGKNYALGCGKGPIHQISDGHFTHSL